MQHALEGNTMPPMGRRACLGRLMGAGVLAVTGRHSWGANVTKDPKVQAATDRALQYLSRERKRQGYWEANQGTYRAAMTALAGTALLCEGSTTTRGKYAEDISLAVDFLLDACQPSGLIGYPDDYHYTYGHGFSMLFLSQVFGEEEDLDRRRRLQDKLEKAVRFSAEAQTSRGGWGYVSAKEQQDFDEGSTCITQVQGLRACRNAGIVVPREIIDRAKKYIQDCTTPEGGVQYSIRGGGPRPPITAAALAALFNAGEYQGDHVDRLMSYCRTNVWPGAGGIAQAQHFGHWHYTHYYYSQVMYRLEKDWEKYFKEISAELMRTQSTAGGWQDSTIGPVYVSAINTTILQLAKGCLPIYQR
ncbi:MAG: terpene cyclase/mutase family protein [Planctomyces sp.]|nr:terpene cyclase/mutase family protein [Planctomyces sp.]